MPNPTSQYITEIEADAALAQALIAYHATAAANAATLGLNPANLTELLNAANEFNADLQSWIATSTAAKEALVNKNQQKAASKAVVSKWAKVFRANLAIPDSLLAELMLPPHKTPGTKTPPSQPTNLVADADGLGLVKLRWSRNGNNATTVFEIQTRASAADEWEALDSTTRVRWSYQAVPGVTVFFRVVAKRNNQTSQPSVPVVLWDGGSGATGLQIAA